MQSGGGELSRERIVPYECGECSEKFFSYKNYKNHMTDHIMSAEEVEQRVMVSNVYQCTACAREFKDKSLLTKHFNMEHAKIARLTGDRKQRKSPIKVGAISETFESPSKREMRAVDISYRRSSYEYTNSHPHQVTGSELKGRFACPDCLREFLNPTALEGHVNKYKNKKLYCCSFCEKKFHFRTSWKRHEECHKSERQVWQCDSCTMTFTQKVNLKRHKEGNKNPCGTGNRLMSMRLYRDRTTLHCLKPVSSASLARYAASDEEEEEDELEEEEEEEEDRGPETKPSTPEPSTTSIDNSHIQKGEAFYACSVCDKLFTYRSLWSRHEKEHHTSKSFDCSVCGTKFTRQYYLARHRKMCLSRMNAQSSDSHRITTRPEQRFGGKSR
ncbi:zinc finger protein 39-like [Bolinopsis microptera]|uniref:zinc finger protein 39-like n=1 Tax=Bolinopsis microptera TaxID=2820187 RepID=UPI00307B06E3